LTGNVAEHWKRFKQAFQIYSAASGLEEKSRKIQSSTLLHVIGSEAVDIYNTFQWGTGDCNEHCDSTTSFHTVECLLAKFESYCIPRKNITIERHVFFARNQHDGETFDSFVTDLKLKAKTCEFATLKDSLIKDKIVGGILSDQVRARLLREADLTLSKAEDICRAAEATEKQLKLMSEENSVNAVMRTKQRQQQQQQQQQQGAPNTDSPKCHYCGRQHQPRRCPAYGQICKSCGKKNHFASVCASSVVKCIAQSHESDYVESEHNEFFIGAVDNPTTSQPREWTSVMEIEGRRITFTLDTGAQVNILPYSIYCRLKVGPLQKSSARLTTYSGERLPVCGKATLTCTVKGRKHRLEFQVVDTQSKAILGLRTCEALDLIQLVDIIGDETLASYADVFKGLGSMEEEYTIQVDHTVRPVVHAPRKVPAALREDLHKELQRMESEGVIEKVEHPTAWVNSLVIVEKKGGGLRLCLDPRDLNQAIRREHYQLPTIEEIASRLSGNKVFSVLDANSAFWQIRLDKNCADLTTFNTPFGRYRFLRLPFGLNSSAEVFAKRFHQAFENIPGVETYMDEMLIAGKDDKEHDERLRRVLDTARAKGIKLKPSKCSLRVKEVKFVGHVITEHGVKPDNSKIEAIQAMPCPTNRKELERFLGMINYLGKFLPNLSDVTAHLRELLKQDTEWQWLEQHTAAVTNLKTLVTQAPVLAFYDTAKSVQLSVDASPDGLGAVLTQGGKPVAFASRSLTDCEKRYAQIEKEMLAVVYGAEHFHYYVYGHEVTIETDHKPLEAIIKKPLSSAPPRLQRMLLRLMKYNVTLKYKAGREMFVPDTLSRAALPRQSPASDDWEAQVHLVVSSLPISDEKMKVFQQVTAEDPTLQTLKKQIQVGWPDKKSDVPDCIRPYSGFQDELSEANGLLFKGEQIIVPRMLQKEMLQKLHQGHLGRDKCLAAARDVLFWPGMSSQIIDTVAKCGICNQHQHSQQKEPMISHDIPTLPWEKIGADLFHFGGKNYLLLVDYYSKYFEINLLPAVKAADVILHMKSQFARHGIPKDIVSDNGPQFSCEDFAAFAKSWGFKHTTTSPRYSQSNGMVERAVQTIKSLLKKAQASGQDPYMALLQYRNTPFPDSPSPAQLLMNRRLRTILPATDTYLRPSVPDHEQVSDMLDKRQQEQQKQYNKTAMQNPFPELKAGQPVRMQMQHGATWRPAVVVSKANEPRSYVVKTPDGAVYRRNRRMLRQTNESFNTPELLEDVEDEQQDDGGEGLNEDEPLPNGQAEANHDANPAPPPVVITRYGRQVRPPMRYPDKEQ